LIGGVAAVVLIVFFVPHEQRPVPPPTQTILPAWGVGLALVAALIFVVGIVLSINRFERSKWGSSHSRQRKIEELTKSLDQALVAVDAIRREIDEGGRLLKRLVTETEVKARLAKLASQDAQAVIVQLEDVIGHATGRSTWLQVAVGFLFFIAGALVSFLVAPNCR
jgi:hypothetical protein